MSACLCATSRAGWRICTLTLSGCAMVTQCATAAPENQKKNSAGHCSSNIDTTLLILFMQSVQKKKLFKTEQCGRSKRRDTSIANKKIQCFGVQLLRYTLFLFILKYVFVFPFFKWNTFACVSFSFHSPAFCALLFHFFWINIMNTPPSDAQVSVSPNELEQYVFCLAVSEIRTR